LAFVKGDPGKATTACGPVEVTDIALEFGEVVDAGASAAAD